MTDIHGAIKSFLAQKQLLKGLLVKYLVYQKTPGFHPWKVTAVWTIWKRKKRSSACFASCFLNATKGAVMPSQKHVNAESTRVFGWAVRLHNNHPGGHRTSEILMTFDSDSTVCLHNLPTGLYFFFFPNHVEQSRALNRAFANRKSTTLHPYKSIMHLLGRVSRQIHSERPRSVLGLHLHSPLETVRRRRTWINSTGENCQIEI